MGAPIVAQLTKTNNLKRLNPVKINNKTGGGIISGSGNKLKEKLAKSFFHTKKY